MLNTPNPLAEVPAGEGRDQELVRLIKGGSRAALEDLVGRHQSWIYNLALRMVHHPADAEDATQEILIKLLTKLSTFDGRSARVGRSTGRIRLQIPHGWQRSQLSVRPAPGG